MAKIKIALNPGHIRTAKRGFAWADEGEGSNNEKTVMLIKKKLEEYENVDVVVVSQSTGTPFEQLGSKHSDATLFYSHHTNAFRGIGRGTEVFYTYGRTLAQNISIKTARIIKTVTREDESGDLGAKRNSIHNMAVLNQAKRAGVKYAFLGEIGFGDNLNEVKYIVNNRQEIADAIGEEIAKYLKLSLKVVPKPPVTPPTSPPVVTPPVQPPVTPIEKPVVLAPAGKLFRVVAQSFKVRNNAEDLQADLLKSGFKSFLALTDDPNTGKEK